ncbi:MAG: hypothetical protein ACK53L_09395, partial [Pirellulaceae bacterium]
TTETRVKSFRHALRYENFFSILRPLESSEPAVQTSTILASELSPTSSTTRGLEKSQLAVGA